jgi:hypothetical protein
LSNFTATARDLETHANLDVTQLTGQLGLLRVLTQPSVEVKLEVKASHNERSMSRYILWEHDRAVPRLI